MLQSSSASSRTAFCDMLIQDIPVEESITMRATRSLRHLVHLQSTNSPDKFMLKTPTIMNSGKSYKLRISWIVVKLNMQSLHIICLAFHFRSVVLPAASRNWTPLLLATKKRDEIVHCKKVPASNCKVYNAKKSPDLHELYEWYGIMFLL